MKTLIIGAAGMLGTALCEVFPEATAWDRVDIDITKEEETATKIAKWGSNSPDDVKVIINAAAYADVDGAEEEQQQAFLVNEIGARNVALAANKIDATLVHYSTDYVFPGDQAAGYAEDATPGPAVNVYGESKLAGEQELAKVGVRFYLIRTAWLYGSHGKNFVDTMLRLAGEGKALRVINDQQGSPTFTKDVASGTLALLSGEYDPGIYHLVNTGEATWYEFAQQIFLLANKQVAVTPISTVEYPLPAGRPRWSKLLNTRGPSMRSWKEALADYLRGLSPAARYVIL